VRLSGGSIAAARSARDERDCRLRPDAGSPSPKTLEREAAVPKDWKAALDRQEDFIEELLGG
jgi:type IV secretion system protein VirD4